MRTKPSRSDSVTSEIAEIANAALGMIEPPEHIKLREGDRPFWEAVIRARGVAEWSDVHLVVAAQLARCQADIEKESAVLDAEGAVLENKKGTPVMNPRYTVIAQLAGREMALMRSLQMVGRASGDPRDLIPGRVAAKKGKEAAKEIQKGDGLLATAETPATKH